MGAGDPAGFSGTLLDAVDVYDCRFNLSLTDTQESKLGALCAGARRRPARAA